MSKFYAPPMVLSCSRQLGRVSHFHGKEAQCQLHNSHLEISIQCLLLSGNELWSRLTGMENITIVDYWANASLSAMDTCAVSYASVVLVPRDLNSPSGR